MTLMCDRGIGPVQGYPVRAYVIPSLRGVSLQPAFILSEARGLTTTRFILSEARGLTTTRFVLSEARGLTITRFILKS